MMAVYITERGFSFTGEDAGRAVRVLLNRLARGQSGSRESRRERRARERRARKVNRKGKSR